MYSIIHLETSNFYKTLLKNICEELSVKYLAVSTAEEALIHLKEKEYNLILSAMELEDGNSVDFIKKINDSEFNNIPIVVITGNDSYEDRKKIFDLGIVDYISKQQNPEEIKKNIMFYKTEDEISNKLSNLSIAVCDDSSMDRYIIERIFNMNKIHSTVFFKSGEELLESEEKFDIYIIDLVLKRMSGKNIIMKLRESGSESVIITISGIDHFKTISNVLMVGADDYITKPFNNDLFMARIKTNVRSYLLLKEVKRKTIELRKAAITDGLSQLYNHKHIVETLAHEIKVMERYPKELSLMMLDIDHFKLINDNYGHQFGDQIIIKVAKIIKDAIRDVDIPGRYGGEEFLIILPETDIDSAVIAAERIRSRVEKIRANREGFKVSISIGVTQFSNQSSSDLIKEADSLLYEAKENGRNRVEY